MRERMAVYKRGYQRYQGATTSRWTRFMALPRFAWRRMFQQRQVIMLTIVSLIWPLLCAIFIYISNHADLLKGFGGGFQTFLAVKSNFFLTFMNVQSTFIIFLAALTGPGLIAPDLANNALPLYFSRPLSRLDYAIARLLTLVAVLSLISWIPGLLLFGMQAGMAEGKWLKENWEIGCAIVAGFFIWILIVSLVALASSAYARLKMVSGGVVLGFFFILSGMATMIDQIFRSHWGQAISPTWATRRIWYSMLKISDVPPGPGVETCLLALAIVVILLILVLKRKLRPVEVVS
jgi:ABC-2 type transport system permease protein